MSSSVLRNVIQPKYTPPSVPGTGMGNFGGHEEPSEDMEQVLGALIENAPVAMAMFDHDMHYMLANRCWIEEFSLQGVHPLIGRSQYEVFPGMHPGWRQVYERALQGHVVRSEHDALSGPDGRRVIYRWEVRPWRRKRDASVGGLMVTCEKFGNAAAMQALTAPEAQPQEKEHQDSDLETSGRSQELVRCTVPMVMLDERGIIQQTNAAAMEIGLSRGVQEGVSNFWDVFADSREASRLQLQWGLVLEKLAGENRFSGWVMELPPLPSQSEERAQVQRWLISVCETEGPGRSYLAMLLPTVAAPPPAPMLRPAAVAAPDLPAIANAVASISQPVPDFPGHALENRRLHDELARARQELRTLHEAERVFTQRESRVRQYLDVLPCGILVLDDLGTTLYQNDPLTKLLGRSVQKDETVENWLGAACPNEDHREEVATVWREDVWRRQLTRTFSLATADGLLKELEFQPSSLPGGGLLLCIQDVTEHCRQEEQLRATEAKFRTLLHEAPLAIVLMDKAGAVFEVNHLAENLLGYPKTELRRYPLDTWLEPEDAHTRREAMRHMLEMGERSRSLEVYLQKPDQDSVAALLTLAPVLDAQGNPHSMVHFFQKKEPVAHIIQAPAPAGPSMSMASSPWHEARPEHSMNPSPGAESVVSHFEQVERMLLRTNVNGRIKEISSRGMELLGLMEGEAKGRSLHLHFRPSDPTGFYGDLSRLAQTPDVATELNCFSRTGERQPVQLCVSEGGEGGFDFELTEMAEVAVHVPVPESFSAPAQAPLNGFVMGRNPLTAPWPVVDLSREKLLLSETHHRIKNHLQIISSLLNLESNTVSDSTALTALRSSQNRVRAIAELHQHLYQIVLGTAESFSTFADGLVQRLRECYNVPEDRVDVRLDLAHGRVQQEWLMPLALTLNETLSNSFEHAFPDDRTGEIQVSLTFGPDEGQLVVRDNGVGLPADFSSSSSTGLGLKILGVFADQMKGQLALGAGNSGGAEIQLRFPIAYADI